MECIAFDSHKHYTWALVQDGAAKVPQELVWNMSQPDLISGTVGSAVSARRARRDSRHVTRTTYCCLDSE
jgi:hypothetical protein